MNKIFKVVWNRTIGSFVVTSELAKGRVKSSSEGAEGDVRASEEGRLKTLFRLTALSAALFGLSESAWAHPIINSEGGKVATGSASETAIGGGSARGVGSVAVGAFAKAGTRIEADGAVAIGGSQASTGAYADGNNAIAIGQASNANAAKAISIGSDTIASHEWTSAYGGRAEAKNLGATALGSWTQASGQFSIAVGGSDRFGRNNDAATIASGDRSTAIGRNAKSAGADAIALGTGAQATLTNSIAIGKNSVATGVNNIAKNPVNVGNAVAIGSGVQALGEDSVAIGVSAGANLTTATTKQSLAIGWTAKATGLAQAVAIGPDAIASGAQSTSIGNNTRAIGDSSIAIGGDDWNVVRTKQVAAAGNKQVHQVFEELTGMPMKQQGEAYKNPFKGTTAGDAAVAIGVTALAEGVLSTAFGSGTSASGIGAAAFGVGATASQDKSVAIGAGSHTRTDATAVTEATVNGVTYRGFAGTEHITTGSQVSFGSAGYERQLKHVAPGAITPTSTDAINGSQLYALHVGAGNIAKSVADALGGGATVGNDPTNNQGSFVTLPSYDVLKGSDKPNTAGNGTAKFNTTPAKNVAAAMTNLNTYVNQGFAVKDNAGDTKGIVTPGESVQFADGNATTVTVDTEANGNTKIKYDVKVDDSTIKVVDGKLTGASQTHFYSVNSADKTKANYNNDGATGENAIAAGPEAKAAASNAVVIGSKATVEAAAGSDSTINGETTGEGSVAVGALSKASGKNATAIGQKANAYGQNSFAGGQDTESSGKSSVAVGDGSRATDNSTTAVGPYAKATKAGASAFGFNANAQAIGSVAVGRQAQALNLNAVSVGNESKAKGEDTVAIGTSADAVQNRAMAIGKGAVANGADTIAFGAATKADQRYAIAIGSGNNAWKTDSIALGRAANADGAASLALGLNSHTRLDNAIALGNGANADHSNSIAIGKSSHAAASAGVAIGNDAQALKYSSVVIGDQAQSNNSRSVVIGYHASATNPAKPASAEEDYNQTVAIGAYANAWGDQSTAIGNNVDAIGNSSIAIGADDWDTVAAKTVEGTGGKTVKEVYKDYTGDVMETGSYTHTTSSEAAVAIGTKSQAIGQLSTAFGTGTIAEGVASAAFGMGAKATQGNSVAIGAGSTTATGATSVNEATVNNLKYSGFAGGNSVNPGDQVSFGSKNYERQLKNVAPGEISNTSTDAINGSQLYAVQNVLGNTAQTVKNVLGGDAAVDENGSITMSNIGNTGKGNIHDAINSVKETAEKGWKLKANEEADSESEKIAAGDTVTVKQGKNIRVKRSSKDLTIETADDVAFNKVTVGNSVLTTDGLNTPQVTAGDSVLGNNGLTIANGAANAPVSLTKDGLNNGGNKVTSIADGVADTDAASYKQVKAAKTEVQKGTNVVSVDKTEGTDGHAIYTVNAKGTAVSAEGTENGLKLTSSEDSTTNVTTYNLDLSDKTKDSLKKADSALQGIDVKVNDENVKTLTKDDSTLKFVNGTGTTAENKGGTVTFNVNKSTLTTGAGGVVSADTAGDVFATAADVAKAINKAVVDSEKTSVVAAGDNTHVAAVEAGNQTTYTVHADNTTVSVKDGGKLALKSSEATNSNHTKTTNYELDLSDDTKAEIQKGVDAKNIVDTKGITFSGNSGSPVTKKLDETLAIKGDDTNVVTESGTDGITVKLKDEITVQTVNADKLKAGDSVLTNDGLNIANGNNPVSLTKSGLSNGGNKITKVAKGENEDDAVNYAQLKELAEKGLTFDADGNTSTSSKKLGERVGIKGGNNITTSADNDNVTVKLNDDITLNSVTATTLKAGDSTLTNAGLVTPKVTAGDSVLGNNGLTIANGAAGSPVSLTKDGLNNGGNKVTDVAKGTADTDAVNVSQLNPVAKALNTNIDPTTGEVAAPSFTVTKADGTKHPAVGTVQDALDKVGEEVTKGLNIVADNGSSEKVNLGDTVKYTSKDKNIVTTSGTGKEIDFSLAEKVTIGKDVANGGKPVVIDGKEGIVSGLTNTTLGTAPLAGSNKAATEAQLDATQVNLKNILGGEAKNENGNVSTEDIGGTGENTIHDAIKSVKATADKGWKLKANEEADSESEKIAAGDTVTVKQGKNILVKRSGKELTIETADDVAFNKVTVGDSVLTTTGLTTPKVTAGDSVLTTDGLNIANGTANAPVSLTKDGLNNGGNKVTNVAKGTADTDGVNVSQLNPVAKALNTNIDPTTGEVAAPSFTVT
ncbi:ESPR-type extended signal peptide-containing protein, partial [Neisseria sicca]